MSKMLFDGQQDDETVMEVFRRHPVVLRKGLYAILFGILLGLLPAAFFPARLEFLWAIPAGFILGLIYFGYQWIGWYFTLFIVTDQRFLRIVQKGLFNRNVGDVDLAKILSINYQIKGLQQTMLGFGTVLIQTFVGDLVLDHVKHPIEVQEALQRAIKANSKLNKEQDADPSVPTG